MSDQHPSEPGVVGSTTGGAPDAPEGAGWAGSHEGGAGGPVVDPPPPPPPVPPIDLSKPEEPAPPSPVDGDPLVSAPDAEPVVPTPPAAGPGTAPAAPDAPPLPPAPPPPPAPESQPEPSGGPKGQAWKMALVVAVFLAVVVVAFLLGKKGGGDSQSTSTPTSSAAPSTKPLDTSSWVTTEDADAGFSIKHPKDWETLPSQGDVQQLFQIGAESFLGITARDIAAEDAPGLIKQALSDVELLEDPRNFSLNGLPAAVYIYKKPVTAEDSTEGVVVHYFALTKTKMYALVFVTSPAEELNRLGRTISAAAESFDSSLESAAPQPTLPSTPTTAGATTSTTG